MENLIRKTHNSVAYNPSHDLCCCPDGRHRHETINEHFTCPEQSEEGWHAHSFLPEDLRRLYDGEEQE